MEIKRKLQLPITQMLVVRTQHADQMVIIVLLFWGREVMPVVLVTQALPTLIQFTDS